MARCTGKASSPSPATSVTSQSKPSILSWSNPCREEMESRVKHHNGAESWHGRSCCSCYCGCCWYTAAPTMTADATCDATSATTPTAAESSDAAGATTIPLL